jgi:hypothetical protein
LDLNVGAGQRNGLLDLIAAANVTYETDRRV